MKTYYCNICDKTINHKSKNRLNKTKRYYFMKNYVTKTYIYNDIDLDDFEKFLHENIISHKNKFNEFKISVLFKINDNIEIKVYMDEHDLCEMIFVSYGKYVLSVYYASKKICDLIHVRVNTTPNMKIKNLTKKFVSAYDNMPYRYYMQQPLPMIVSKMVKHKKKHVT